MQGPWRRALLKWCVGLQVVVKRAQGSPFGQSANYVTADLFGTMLAGKVLSPSLLTDCEPGLCESFMSHDSCAKYACLRAMKVITGSHNGYGTGIGGRARVPRLERA